MSTIMLRNIFNSGDLADVLDNVQEATEQADSPEQQQALAEAGQRVEEILRADRSLITKIEAQIDASPDKEQLKADMLEVAIANPAAFSERLEEIQNDPASLSRVVAELKTLGEQAAPVVAEEATAAPEPIEVAEVGGGDMVAESEPAAAPAVSSAAAATPEAVETEEDPLAQLAQAPGFEEFKAKIENHPELNEVVTKILDERGADAGQSGDMLGRVKAVFDKDPNFIIHMNSLLDQNPGAVSAIATQIAEDPEAGFQSLGVAAMARGYMDMLGGFFEALGLGGGFMDFLNGLFDKFMPAMAPFLSMMTDLGEIQEPEAAGNDGAQMVREALAKSGATNASVTLADGSVISLSETEGAVRRGDPAVDPAAAPAAPTPPV